MSDDLHPAALDERSLLAQCDTRRQRRSGPGGQHRNKVETAVVISHRGTAVMGEASERRSQEENRRRALFRLRVNLALAVRRPTGEQPSAVWQSRCRAGRIRIRPDHVEFPQLLAEVLDVLDGCDMDVGFAARRFRCTASQLVKFLQREPRALEQVNRRREQLGLKRLR